MISLLKMYQLIQAVHDLDVEKIKSIKEEMADQLSLTDIDFKTKFTQLEDFAKK